MKSVPFASIEASVSDGTTVTSFGVRTFRPPGTAVLADGCPFTIGRSSSATGAGLSPADTSGFDAK